MGGNGAESLLEYTVTWALEGSGLRIVIVDGQGGGIGKALVERIRREPKLSDAELICVGTNAIATSAMLRAGAVQGATGENAVAVCCRDADVIAGPIGIVLKDAMLGEITPAMAEAVAGSRAERVLIPVARCKTHIAGFEDAPLAQLVDHAVRMIAQLS